jgi:hypothetical protein
MRDSYIDRQWAGLGERRFYEIEGRTYVLEFTDEAAAQLEAVRGHDFNHTFERAFHLKCDAIVDFLWVYLQADHADEFPATEEGFSAVSALIEAALGPWAMLDMLAPGQKTSATLH